MIPMHPEATDDAQRLRWVVRHGLGATGRVRRAPAPLARLLESGVVVDVSVRTTDILVTLAQDESWRSHGDSVRTALGDALQHPQDWVIDRPDSDADRLGEVTLELLDGPIGALAASHGGSIELVSVTDDVVTVSMSGACHGCPASGSTLYDRLQRELRHRCSEQVVVRGRPGPRTRGPFRIGA